MTFGKAIFSLNGENKYDYIGIIHQLFPKENTMEKQLIRAKDYLPVKPELAEGTTDELVNETDGLTTRLFGAAPDYTQKEYEDLWQAVFNADEQEMIDYCREKGIDVLDDDGVPVSGWRDVAVMLKAVDAGIVKKA